MRKEIELDILANSRLAETNSKNVPTIMGCIIISVIYGTARLSWINLFFMWGWIILACHITYTWFKIKKIIMEQRKNGG